MTRKNRNSSNRRRSVGNRNAINANSPARQLQQAELEDRRSMPKSTIYLSPRESRKIQNYDVNQTIRIRRSLQVGTIQNNTSADNLGSFLFALNQLPNYTEFTALFDSYRIDAVRLTFISRQTNITGAINGGLVYTAVDYDDATAVGTLAGMLQYDNLQYHRFVTDEPWSVLFKPHLGMAAYNSSAALPAVDMADVWLDAGNPDVVHYGLKWYAPVSGQAGFIDVLGDFYLSFKSVR